MTPSLFADPTARRTVQARRAWWARWAFPELGELSLEVTESSAWVRQGSLQARVPLRERGADLVGQLGGWTGVDVHVARVRGGMIARVRWSRLGVPAATTLLLVEAQPA